MKSVNQQIIDDPAKRRIECPSFNDEILAIENLSLTLGENKILSGINFCLPQSGVTTLIGPSGAGKTSILRCINMLVDNWTGDIVFHGLSLRDNKTDVDLLRKKIGLIGQKPVMFHCSIYQNLVFGLPRKKRKNIKNEEVEAVLRKVGLHDEFAGRMHENAADLSVGQQQRLAIARALMTKPEILLLDEPTSSLDPLTKEIVENSLLRLAEDMPLLLVTHDMSQAKRLGGYLYFLCDGKIVEQGESADFFSSPKRVESKEFLNWDMCDCS